ncbi:hypothetical protein ACJJTC_011706 [Scirpophaga incertulas]
MSAWFQVNLQTLWRCRRRRGTRRRRSLHRFATLCRKRRNLCAVVASAKNISRELPVRGRESPRWSGRKGPSRRVNRRGLYLVKVTRLVYGTIDRLLCRHLYILSQA